MMVRCILTTFHWYPWSDRHCAFRRGRWRTPLTLHCGALIVHFSVLSSRMCGTVLEELVGVISPESNLRLQLMDQLRSGRWGGGVRARDGLCAFLYLTLYLSLVTLSLL